MRLVNLNNELQEALIGEEQEILRIYRELSALVKQHSNDLMDACEKVSHIEFVYGKASLAISYKGVPAILSTDRTVNLMRARHPLIPPNVVVPTNIQLGTSYRILLITGSNTGGKTVSLKTIRVIEFNEPSVVYLSLQTTAQCCLYSKISLPILGMNKVLRLALVRSLLI